MTKKRAIKLMMSYGYSRNEARYMQKTVRYQPATNATITNAAMWLRMIEKGLI